MDFPCTSCGACCRQIPADSPMNLGSGVCRHLDPASQRCAIYAQRPLICRVDDLYQAYLAESVAPRVYYLMQAHACAGLDPANASLPGIVARWVAARRDGDPSERGGDDSTGRPDLGPGTLADHHLDPADAADGYEKLMAVVSTLVTQPEPPRKERAAASHN